MNFLNTLRQSPVPQKPGTGISAAQTSGVMEGIDLERKMQVILQVLTQCDFQVLAQEIPCHFLSPGSTRERETVEVLTGWDSFHLA